VCTVLANWCEKCGAALVQSVRSYQGPRVYLLSVMMCALTPSVPLCGRLSRCVAATTVEVSVALHYAIKISCSKHTAK
jgi:hypothetical protein